MTCFVDYDVDEGNALTDWVVIFFWIELGIWAIEVFWVKTRYI